MDISIHPQLQQFLREQLNAGHYDSVGELVNDAVARLQHEIRFAPEADEDLKREIELGIEELDRGEGVAWDPEGLWEEVERRYADERGANGGKWQDPKS